MRGLHSSITRQMLHSPADQAQCRNLAPRLSGGGGLTVGIGDEDDRDWLSCWHGRWNDGYSDINGQKNGIKKAGDRVDEFGHCFFS